MKDEFLKLAYKTEIWLPIDLESYGCEEGKYYASSWGQVRSNKTVLSQCDNGRGYPCVSLSVRNDKGKACGLPKTVHLLVANAFMKSFDSEGKEIHHLDGDRWNNHLANLTYLTPEDNAPHAHTETCEFIDSNGNVIKSLSDKMTGREYNRHPYLLAALRSGDLDIYKGWILGRYTPEITYTWNKEYLYDD